MKLTLIKKLSAGFLVILMILGATVAISYSRITIINKEYGVLLGDKVQKLILIQELEKIIQKEQLNIRGYLINGDEASLQSFISSHDNYLTLSNQLKEIVVLPKAEELIQELDQLETEFYQIATQEGQLKKQGQTEEYLELVEGKGHGITEAFNSKAKELTEYQQNVLMDGHKEVSAQIKSIKVWVLVLGITAVLLGAVVAVYLGRMISKPVITISNAAEKIAAGNLTIPEITVKNNDEIGDLAISFNQMTRNLREVICQVGSNAEQVAASAEELTASAEETSIATEQIASVMHEVASGVDNQFKTIEESSNTINEMAVGVREIAQNTQHASDKAMEAHDKASAGSYAIQTAVGQMNSIHQTVNELATVITGLGKRSTEIGRIIEEITEISAQTNLLALNATIEAARAGEHGRGFAVVAEEVHKLADQSSLSAQKVSTMIASIQNETGQAIRSMNTATQEVTSGIKIVNTAGESFKHIQTSVNAVSSQVQEVSSSVQQMAAGAEQLVNSMKYITEVSENTASSIQEVAASAGEQEATMKEVTAAANSLSLMAEQLQKVLEGFKV